MANIRKQCFVFPVPATCPVGLVEAVPTQVQRRCDAAGMDRRMTASAVGLEGKTINGMAFTLYNGQAWFDRAGKTP
jgi:hypothetical protein